MTFSLQNQWGISAFMCLFTLLHEKQNQIHRTTATLWRERKNPNHPQSKSHKQNSLPNQPSSWGWLPYAYCITTLAEWWRMEYIPHCLWEITWFQIYLIFRDWGRGRKTEVCEVFCIGNCQLTVWDGSVVSIHTLVDGRPLDRLPGTVNWHSGIWQFFRFSMHILRRWTQRSENITSQGASFCTPQCYWENLSSI